MLDLLIGEKLIRTIEFGLEGFSCFECLRCFAIEVPCRVSRFSIQCATGKRCLRNQARIMALSDSFEFNASYMACLNCLLRCFDVIDSLYLLVESLI